MQQIAIIASLKDPAGVNIRANLIELFDFQILNERFDGNEVYQNDKIKDSVVKLYLINDDLIFSDSLDKKIEADVFLFASKHRSKENTKSFAVHSIGNWDENEFGGKERALCKTCAVLVKNLFLELNNFAKYTGYEITLEATHHGPFMEKSSIFCEIGSTQDEWQDTLNGEIMAKTIMAALNNPSNKYKIAIGMGGPHYCNNFNKVVLRSDIAISHVCPKYMLEKLDEHLIKESIAKTKQKIDFVLLDWKGLGNQKQRIADLLKNLKLEIKRTDQVLKD